MLIGILLKKHRIAVEIVQNGGAYAKRALGRYCRSRKNMAWLRQQGGADEGCCSEERAERRAKTTGADHAQSLCVG